jgi:tetratricopeptide (TPR) repeat protein
MRELLLQRSLVRRGTTATDLQRYDDAERDLLDAVALARQIHGDSHAETLKAQQALGWHYVARGLPQQGLSILEPVGERVREVFGENSQERARNFYNRGNAYLAIEGRWEAALEAYRESARIYRVASSPSISIGALYNVASLLREHGRCAEALPVLAEVEQIWRATPELPDAQFRRVHTDAAACALETGDLQAARSSLAKAAPFYPADQQQSGDYADLLAVSSAIAAAEGDVASAQSRLRQAIALISGDPARAVELGQWRQRLSALAP